MRRLFAAAEASALGRGGVTKVANATGISRRANPVGLAELAVPKIVLEGQDKRIRKAGVGRKSVIKTADGGGSNGSRVRLWKFELQRLADEINIPIYVSHLPPGNQQVEQN